MLSAGGMHYPQSFGRLSSANMVTQHDQHQHQPPMSGLDALAQGSQYALQQLHDSNIQSSHRDSDSYQQNDQSQNTKGSNVPVRRRISRACDQCNQLRTKCDGKTPCAHCVEFGLSCEYNRERKKRGKASRKDLAAQQASTENGQESPQSGHEASLEGRNGSENASDGQQPSSLKRRRSSAQPHLPQPQPRTLSMPNQQIAPPPLPPPSQQTQHHLPPLHMNKEGVSGSTNDQYTNMQSTLDAQGPPHALPTPRLNHVSVPDRGSLGVTEFTGNMEDYNRSVLQQPQTAVTAPNHHSILPGPSGPLPNSLTHTNGMMFHGESPYAVPSPQSQTGINAFRMGESPISAHGFMGTSPHGGSPGWLQLPSPSAALYTHYQQPSSQTLRYPVLKPILSRISAIIPISLACDLLEIYFSSSYSKFVQPASPYVLGIIFRKNSFLRQTNPRQCSPALLASMLWVGAQTSESAFLTSPPSARGKVCQKLLELTVSLLRPLIHTPTENTANPGSNPVVNGVALGGFGVALHTARHDNEGGSTGAAGALDDVATYINLATVVSASEYKAASLRWWNAAWSLARELKLGRELPPNPDPPISQDDNAIAEGNAENEMGMSGQPNFRPRRQSNMHAQMNQPGMVTEEEREERRRIWWLLYIVDRHLALCYNRPLFLLDAECESLQQPEDETVYQMGEFYTVENSPENYYKRRGPPLECTGHSIFGYFLPLMTILGEIVDLNHTRNHPRFGMRFRNGTDLDDMAQEISLQLQSYGRSLEAFESRFIPTEGNNTNNEGGAPHTEHASPSNQSTSTSGNRITETVLLTKTIVAYGTHLMHTLHILLNGKWDPISLLDDNDLWISSQSFISATGHAVSAAEAIAGILDYDPDLSFMPFFFGIYLLQGSFLLLLIADKLQGEASQPVVKACEQIVRAHEVCVVTLNTEYQRNFRKVMRSALQQVRGRTLEDFGEQQQRRREVLALYRWTGDGSGLAL